MPHHTQITTTTVENYSSNSSSSSDSTKTVEELATTQVYEDGLPDFSPKDGYKLEKNAETTSASVSQKQTNVGMFQTINNHQPVKIEQQKEKTTCCDCLFSLFLSK